MSIFFAHFSFLRKILYLIVSLYILGYCILPETLTVQIGADGGTGNVLPKVLGLLIPSVICCLFSFLYYQSGEKKHLLGICIGVLCYILIFSFNL